MTKDVDSKEQRQRGDQAVHKGDANVERKDGKPQFRRLHDVVAYEGKSEEPAAEIDDKIVVSERRPDGAFDDINRWHGSTLFSMLGSYKSAFNRVISASRPPLRVETAQKQVSYLKLA